MVTGLYIVAMLSLMIGGYGIYSGIVMDTSVQAYDGSGSIANLQLMHLQSMNLSLGASFLLIAAITLSAGAIIETIRSNKNDGDLG